MVFSKSSCGTGHTLGKGAPLRSSKGPLTYNWEDSQPGCVHVAEIGQFGRPVAGRDVLDKVGDHMATVLESERKRVDEFQNFGGQTQVLGILDRACTACSDFLPERLLRRIQRAMLRNGDKLLA